MDERGTMDGEIADRLVEVRERVARAARAAGREPGSVRVIAVSKTKPVESIRLAYAAGQRDFGENYVQELQSKALALADLPDLCWHFIGHVQTNKARRVVEVAHVLHTVDSVRVARELGRRAAAAGRVLPVLVEVNVGEERTKTGAAVQEAGAIVEAVRGQGSLALRGLMTVPPFELEAKDAAGYFDRLRALRDELGGEGQLPELSMGMSHDFEVAIERGATMVRIGTAIFGAR